MSNSPDMTTIFYARQSDRFIGIKSNLRRRKLCRTNRGSNFLGSSFSNRDNARTQCILEKKDSPSILKRGFSLRTEQSFFTLITPELFNQPNKNVFFENVVWERKRNISILMILHLSFLISNITLLILLFTIKQVTFSQNGNLQATSSPILLVGQIQVQKQTLIVVLTRCLLTYWAKISITTTDSIITDSHQ